MDPPRLNVHVDTTLRALGSAGRYQLLQSLILQLSNLGAACQLLCNIFVGRDVTSQECTHHNNDTSSPDHGVAWNTSHVTYGKCEIAVSKDNLSDPYEEHSCLYGYDYGYSRELSFRTEFDLVCDRKLLGGLVQTLLFLGQGVGAVLSSICSDRFGRKKVLVISELGLLVFGVGAGFSPSYPVLAVLKFLIGAFQQGVVTSAMTMSIEWFPEERRALASLLTSTIWSLCCCTLALNAFLLQDYTWRYLQFTLSAFSLVAFVHWWYLDESLRWLAANGRKEAAVKLLTRAARVNRKDLTSILSTLDPPASDKAKADQNDSLPNGDKASEVVSQMTSPVPHENPQDVTQNHSVRSGVNSISQEILEEAQPSPVGKQNSSDGKKTKMTTILDILRHRRLLINALIMWFAWFTTAFAFFALYMTSSNLYGNRFLNYFLTSIMEMPPGLIFYFFVDRTGRKGIIRPLYVLAGLGLISSGLLRYFAVNSALEKLSVAAAMLGMVGASGMFQGVFLFTPEMFPTNVRVQALGISSFAGRFGGMLAPFMTDLGDVAVWAPGALIGSLCFCVVIAMHFLPETKGRELPDTIEDIKSWYRAPDRADAKKIYVSRPGSRI